MSKPRIIAKAADLAPDQRYCTCCEKPLTGKFAWLEREIRSGLYHDFGDIPEANSQGWFPFGMTCASRLKTEAEHKRATTPCPA